MASKEQKEGVARIFDTLAASTIIGAIVGLSGHSVMSLLEVSLLCALCPALVSCGWLLRRPPK